MTKRLFSLWWLYNTQYTCVCVCEYGFVSFYLHTIICSLNRYTQSTSFPLAPFYAYNNMCRYNSIPISIHVHIRWILWFVQFHSQLIFSILRQFNLFDMCWWWTIDTMVTTTTATATEEQPQQLIFSLVAQWFIWLSTMCTIIIMGICFNEYIRAHTKHCVRFKWIHKHTHMPSVCKQQKKYQIAYLATKWIQNCKSLERNVVISWYLVVDNLSWLSLPIRLFAFFSFLPFTFCSTPFPQLKCIGSSFAIDFFYQPNWKLQPLSHTENSVFTNGFRVVACVNRKPVSFIT